MTLFTGDVSAGGLYVPTDATATMGEKVQLELTLPDGASLPVTGQIVNIITPEDAARVGKAQGLGIQLFAPEQGPERDAFVSILERAKAAQPQPPAPQEPEPQEEEIDPHTEELTHDAVETAVAAQPKEPEVAAAPSASSPPPAATPLTQRREGRIIGIDLGTTFTSVGAVIDNRVEVLSGKDGTRSCPSVVSFLDDGSYVVGLEARQRAATQPARTVVSPKRILGRQFDEREVQTYVGQAPYRTFAGPDGSVVLEIDGHQYAVTQIIGYILRDARELAEHALGEPVTQAVVSIPISFEEERIATLRRAGQMARLDIVAIIDEPSAAALANRFDPHFGGVVGVYDFGGGTFDFSVVDVSQGDFQVLATAGDTWLGGDDFDRVLAEAASNQFWRVHKVDLRRQAMEWQRLLFACEKAKRELSEGQQAVIWVPEVLRTASGMVDMRLTIDRAILSRACAAVIQRSLDTCGEALDLLGMRPNELTQVYLSGGTTYIPAVRDAMGQYFGVPVRTGVPPEHAVCLGAAIHAAQMQFQASRTLVQR